MSEKISFHRRINIRILIVMLVLFAITAAVVSIGSGRVIRRLYEDSFTERVLLSNALMANIIDSNDVSYFVDLLTKQDDAFKQRQLQFFYDREELFRLQEEGAPEESQQELLAKLNAFHAEMDIYKTDYYWKTIADLQQLKEVSHSAYAYVMAYTGLVSNEGDKLYTYILDADDTQVYDSPDLDGLGTCNIGEDVLEQIYETRKQMDYVEYYLGDYGELYFAYAPILNNSGNVVAVLGTDLDLEGMNAAISVSIITFNSIFLAAIIVIILVLFIFLRRSIINPLGSLTKTAHELAEGNVYAQTSVAALRQRTEIGMLAHAVNDMSLAYQDMIRNTAKLFAAANVGRLDIRNDTTKFKGDIRDVMQQINDTLDSMTLFLDSVPEGIFIMSKDFEVYFRNEHYLNCFENKSAQEFFADVFAQEAPECAEQADRQAHIKDKVAETLKQENNSITVWIDELCYSISLTEITLKETAENSVLVIVIDITDLMKEKEKAQAAAEAKSSFLSRMSHEMRTPMNAIIGMAKIAEDTSDASKMKYCLSTIGTSSKQLLGIINDVLDMSKIEAGKLELESIEMNIEKMLMNVCNIIIDHMEKKSQKFNVVLGKELELNYFADDLRLSQVITNLLSNAVKYTPECGKITLTVDKTGQEGNTNTLLFSVSDNGIGMTEEQIDRLFNAFEQADGSISRRFGGTGLGLAISKNIVEKMGGRIWVESEYGAGSTFSFEVKLERASHQDTIIFDGIRPEDVKLLIVESDSDVMKRFLSITEKFGVRADAAATSSEAIGLVEAAKRASRAYDIIFLAHDMPDADGFDIVDRISGMIDKNTVIIITTLLEWRQIEDRAIQNNITRCIHKPIFPSSVLDAINDVMGTSVKSLGLNKPRANKTADLSGVSILLAEDVEINREIFSSLLEDTHITIDTAENGSIAVSKFAEDPRRYDIIVMDVQMPEMDGYQATRAIRAMDEPIAKTIPIIAMTANVFREDIERCLESGMNDHLSKPIDEKVVIEKILHYSKKT